MAEFLSIGIAAMNEEESIERTVRNLTSTYAWTKQPDNEKELIICINGSTDNTNKVCAELSKQIPQLRVIIQPRADKNAAINHIARATNPRTQNIYFSDADVLVRRTTIDRVISALESNPNAEFAAPRIKNSAAFIPKNKRGVTSQLGVEVMRLVQQYEYDFFCAMGFAVRKSFLLANPLPIGKNLGDDVFIQAKYRSKIIFVRNAEVIFRQATSFRDQVKQRTRLMTQKRLLFSEYPQLLAKKKANAKKHPVPTKTIVTSLSPKAKVGAVINQAAEIIARVRSQKPKKVVWTKVSSTKIGHRK